MIRVLLFDLDGVLVDAKGWHEIALNQALVKYGYSEIPHWQHLQEFDGLPTRVKLKKLLDKNLIKETDIAGIKQQKQIHTLECIQQFCAPDVVKSRMIQELAKRYLLGCVSNAVKETVELMLNKTNLRSYFQLILSNEDIQKPKPDKEIYDIAYGWFLLNYGIVYRNEFLDIEDNSDGVQAAKAAGVLVAHLQYHEITLERIKQEIAKYG